ncbi:immunoglobulin superfamily member 1-like [Mauremys mutica]|uniref:immunoglobulin superfamily member 1-like n=1 Tax=Mauremys mutica TaxID=74926 RepID=UPI001D165635|nr:immunoglobulin superfamily member 1-like [Mauremys mutica]
MASALTVLFLGCWLAGRSGVSGKGSLPKPSISVSPGGVIPLGGNITIRCRHQRLGMRFLLYKDGAGNYLNYTDPAGSEAKFPITSARREHGGSYTCHYSNRTDPPAYSEPSDPVQIIVAEPSYTKPNISLRSRSWGVSLGGSVAIWCRGQHRGMRFVLNKERCRFQPVDSNELEVVFPISNVSREDGGSYSCFYHNSSEPFNVSYPSDPVELVVRDPSLPRPNISLSPTGVTASGANVTIRCQGQHRDVRFFLHKAGDLNPQRHMDTAGAGAEFRIPSVGQQHRGNYSCSYQNRSESEPFVSSQPSDPVQLVVAGGSELKLSIPIIAGVSAAAASLLLLVAFLCCRRTRGGKGPAPRQSRESEPATTVYALMDEGTQMDVLPQEPDPGAEGLTYAELDRQAL